jgi:hypothetical protein
MGSRSSWLLVPALAFAAGCGRGGERSAPPAAAISDDLGKFATGGLDVLIGTETR